MGGVHRIRHHDLKEGDAVRLKAGGPIMIVAIAEPDIERAVQCVWIAKRRLRHDNFLPVLLDVVARA